MAIVAYHRGSANAAFQVLPYKHIGARPCPGEPEVGVQIAIISYKITRSP